MRAMEMIVNDCGESSSTRTTYDVLIESAIV